MTYIERTSLADVPAVIHHVIDVPICCPASQNPRPGSKLRISYKPTGIVVPVEALDNMVSEYVGGLGSIRGMEEMIQDIARRCAAITGVVVRCRSDLIIAPPFGGDLQNMFVTARALAAGGK